jgi:hypothetical protein
LKIVLTITELGLEKDLVSPYFPNGERTENRMAEEQGPRATQKEKRIRRA